MRCLESTRADQVKRFSDPFDHDTDTRLPGEQYTLNQQCQLALGNGYRAYTSNKAPFQVSTWEPLSWRHSFIHVVFCKDVCRELWCLSNTWATPAHPALEGSTCGRRKSCYQGICVDKQRAFAQSKIKMYNNRRKTSSSVHEASSSGSSNSSARPTPSFMRRVQKFLSSAIGSVVRFFG